MDGARQRSTLSFMVRHPERPPGCARREALCSHNGRKGRRDVRIIAKRTLVDFWHSGHGDAEQPLKAWHALAKAANWSQPNEIKAKFSTASFLANNRVVFNISSNKYRLVVKVVYELKTIYIRFIGSHADYDRIDASTI
jgi:mRNA interferase HigB